MEFVPVAVCTAGAALAAWALSGFMRSTATSSARILQGYWHVLVAGILGGLAGLAGSWTERAAFVVLAVAGGLLAVVDFAEERLPNRIVLPLLPITAGLLTLAAWTTGDWPALLRAGLAAAAMFVLYLVMALLSPDLGFGDVKLAAVTGATGGWFGWGAVLLGFGAAWIGFAAAAVVLLATRRRERSGSLAFGPFLIAGAAIGVLWARASLGW